jgi:hypothetical protein
MLIPGPERKPEIGISVAFLYPESILWLFNLREERGFMEYEYVADIAGELSIDGDYLTTVINQLKIHTVKLAVPPYGVDVSMAMDHQDAERLRSHFSARPRFLENSGNLSCPCKGVATA